MNRHQPEDVRVTVLEVPLHVQLVMALHGLGLSLDQIAVIAMQPVQMVRKIIRRMVS